MQYRESRTADISRIIQLLKANDLPHSDVDGEKIKFIIGENASGIQACIGLEKYGADGLLRSFAVTDALKGQGIGHHLLQLFYDFCKNENVLTLHLLTTTAKDYFLKKGFIETDKSAAPDSILATSEFSELCPASSTYMTSQNF